MQSGYGFEVSMVSNLAWPINTPILKRLKNDTQDDDELDVTINNNVIFKDKSLLAALVYTGESYCSEFR